MSKESFLLALLIYDVNKEFIDVAGQLASLSSKLLFPTLKNCLFNLVS